MLKTGTVLGGPSNQVINNLRLYGHSSSNDKVLFEAPFLPQVWHNFAIELNYESNNVRVFYSFATNPLTQRTSQITNDLSGSGELHFGLLKKPTGNTPDVVTQGYQPKGINEGVFWGGIFVENGSLNCSIEAGNG